ncbi:hypothetical protein ACVWXO_000486 [Bradyrhizobium sp. LM2.7]
MRPSIALKLALKHVLMSAQSASQNKAAFIVGVRFTTLYGTEPAQKLARPIEYIRLFLIMMHTHNLKLIDSNPIPATTDACDSKPSRAPASETKSGFFLPAANRRIAARSPRSTMAPQAQASLGRLTYGTPPPPRLSPLRSAGFRKALRCAADRSPPCSGARAAEVQSRLRKSAQDVKWSFCLTTGTIGPRIRRDDEQTSTPESLTGLQGEGGSGRRQRRSDDSPNWPSILTFTPIRLRRGNRSLRAMLPGFSDQGAGRRPRPQSM